MTTRDRLVRAAAKDSADAGTRWRARLEAWLKATARVDPRNYRQIFRAPFFVTRVP